MNITYLKPAGQFAGVSILTLALAACGSSDSSNDNTPAPTAQNPDDSSVKAVVVNASAGGFSATADDPANKYTYFNFATGEVVETH